MQKGTIDTGYLNDRNIGIKINGIKIDIPAELVTINEEENQFNQPLYMPDHNELYQMPVRASNSSFDNLGNSSIRIGNNGLYLTTGGELYMGHNYNASSENLKRDFENIPKLFAWALEYRAKQDEELVKLRENLPDVNIYFNEAERNDLRSYNVNAIQGRIKKFIDHNEKLPSSKQDIYLHSLSHFLDTEFKKTKSGIEKMHREVREEKERRERIDKDNITGKLIEKYHLVALLQDAGIVEPLSEAEEEKYFSRENRQEEEE